MAGGLDDLVDFDVSDAKDLQIQTLGVARQLGEAVTQVSQMITAPDSSLIYWVASNASGDRLRLHAAPLHVGPLVEEHLFHKKESVVLTSATLRTDNTFDFLRERLNAWDADELAVGSPFDYRNSTLVYLVNDIPEPGQSGYQQAVEQGMTALFRATEGRSLALFTSYNQLRATPSKRRYLRRASQFRLRGRVCHGCSFWRTFVPVSGGSCWARVVFGRG